MSRPHVANAPTRDWPVGRYSIIRRKGMSLRDQRVRRSTHGAASRCLSAPPSTSRCLSSVSTGICSVEVDSGQTRREPDDRRKVADPHGALIRNEGAVGSNPITSTSRTASDDAVLCRPDGDLSFRCVRSTQEGRTGRVIGPIRMPHPASIHSNRIHVTPGTVASGLPLHERMVRRRAAAIELLRADDVGALFGVEGACGAAATCAA